MPPSPLPGPAPDPSAAGLTSRPTTGVDAIANRYFAAKVALSPILATYLGKPGHDEDLDDLSPDGHLAHSDLRLATLRELDGAVPVDHVDRVTIAAMRERLGLAEETYRAGLDEMALNVIASPIQDVRGIFDLMPTDDDAAWAVIAERMSKVPQALAQYRSSLLAARRAGNVAPKRQVTQCIRQCADLIADDGYFAGLAAGPGASAGPHQPLSDAVRRRLSQATTAAAVAYDELGRFLADELLDAAPEADACGPDRYALLSRSFVGATVDLEETYRWGQEELARITAEMAVVADRISAGGSVGDAIAVLDRDPAYQLHGTDELRAWMQAQADGVIADLADTHFDIPEPVRTIECMIAPVHTGGIYYTGPSDDFSRPGRMWWSVPKGVTEFGTWRELTTVYHEGVPGHHLQIGQTVFRSATLNDWRRLDSWTSGHGEGWALYAERLMAELGYMDDPSNRMGLLDGQSLRAARVVIDIGVHCGLAAPAEVGGGAWTYDKAWQFLVAYANMDEAFLRFELDRYLGWPGQAPSYKIGERLWLDLREQVRLRDGADFDLRRFHRAALDVGSVALDVLRDAVLSATA